jgi:hypothetical protein
MKTISIKSPDGKTTFEIHSYKAGESVEIFKGSTGVFGKAAGSKTAGLVYVVRGENGVTAQDSEVDGTELWDWIQTYMQIGMNSYKILPAK